MKNPAPQPPSTPKKQPERLPRDLRALSQSIRDSEKYVERMTGKPRG